MKPATTKNHSANQHEPSFHGCEAERSMGTFEQDRGQAQVTELSWMDGDDDRGRGGGTGESGV